MRMMWEQESFKATSGRQEPRKKCVASKCAARISMRNCMRSARLSPRSKALNPRLHQCSDSVALQNIKDTNDLPAHFCFDCKTYSMYLKAALTIVMVLFPATSTTLPLTLWMSTKNNNDNESEWNYMWVCWSGMETPPSPISLGEKATTLPFHHLSC